MTRLTDKVITQQKIVGNPNLPKFSFNKKGYDTLIETQGYDVIYEKAVRCPCKSRNSGSQSNCKNCGATGWVFINPSRTKMVVQAMSLNPEYKEWGVTGAEVSSVTARDIDKLSFMDRITVLNALSEHSETLFFDFTPDASRLYTYAVYPIKEVYYAALFEGSGKPLKRLILDTDFTITDRTKVTLSEAISNRIDSDDISVTIRYSHNPVYHVVEVVRDSMSSPIYSGNTPTIEQMPLHARAKKADLIKDLENFNGDRLFDNSFNSDSCDEVVSSTCI